MMDLKHLDSQKHRMLTGCANERIIANAQRLAQTGKPIIFRIPVVPSVNDTPAEIRAIVTFIRSLVEQRAKRNHGKAMEANIQLELLPFHRLAADKYRSLGLDYRAYQIDPPTDEKIDELIEIARAYGIAVAGK